MNLKDYDLKDSYNRIIKAQAHHRTIESIIDDLKVELHTIKEESLLIHCMRVILELDNRATSRLFDHLQSPMKQTLYLIDLFYSIEDRKELHDVDEKRWDRITLLLDDIEMNYFFDVAFPNNGDIFHDERDELIDVSLGTFLGYFGNAKLCYEEQTLDRITRYFKPYDSFIRNKFGFTIDEAILFILHVRSLNNRKFGDIALKGAAIQDFYMKHPEEWRKLTKKFEERGIDDPREWCFQPELAGLFETYSTNPGEINRHSEIELLNVGLAPNVTKSLLDFFRYDKEKQKGQTIYYADSHYSEQKPLIQLGQDYICPINKFLLEALYNRLNEALQRDVKIGAKYKKNKDIAFEEKVLEVFRRFFPSKTKIFTNYCVDGIAENDLLIIYNDTCIIVEIKDCGFRAPFRDPIKAFDRIKKDYGSSIQLGYEQCVRVEDILLSGKDVDICDADNKKRVLYQLKSKSIKDVWSIVVTDFKYGCIQTNLGSLLKKKGDALYPWSVCIDDLETMLLLMKKLLKGIAPYRFIEFLDYREQLQEHVTCFDELEICGWYLCDREQFKEYASRDSMINTTPTMGEIFDAYFKVGLGFDNELDMEAKRHYRLQDYPKTFEMTEMTGAELKN